ncbi:MAG: hypothetical protein WEC15_02565 [Flavobacteriales bacterium]
MKNTLTILLLLLSTAVLGQREYLEDKDVIQQRAIAELGVAMHGPDGFLYKTVVKEKLTGRYHLEISLGDKGDIRSVQVLERIGGDIPSQNRFKQLVHDSRFSSFKTPKGKQYRIEHHFDLDAIHR